MPLFRKAVPPIELDSHVAQDDVPLRAAYAAAEAGDWVPVRDLLAGTREDFGRRDAYVSALSEAGMGADVAAYAEDQSGPVPQLDLTTTWADRWAEAEPDNPDAVLIRARSFVSRAWEVRGSGWAKTVKADEWKEFGRILRAAVPLCHQASALAPDDPAPWNVLLWAGIGLGIGRDDFDRCYAEVVARDPASVAGHHARLSYLCEKWYGSHEEMFAFARDSAAIAPSGSPLHVLPLDATAEWAMREYSKGDRKIAYRVTMYHMKDPGFHAELDRALSHWFATSPVRHGAWYADLNTLAYNLYEAERHRDAKPVFEAIGQYKTDLPWDWQGGEKAFLEARAKAIRS